MGKGCGQIVLCNWTHGLTLENVLYMNNNRGLARIVGQFYQDPRLIHADIFGWALHVPMSGAGNTQPASPRITVVELCRWSFTAMKLKVLAQVHSKEVFLPCTMIRW